MKTFFFFNRDLRTDHNEQLVCFMNFFPFYSDYLYVIIFPYQIPEQDASIQDISIDSTGSFMAAINNKVWKQLQS